MDPQEQVVNETESAPVDTQLQQTEGQEGQVAAGENVQQEQQPVAQGQVQIDAIDETGVPYKNRFMETQRKLAELSDNLPKIIQETLAKQQQQTPQEKQYTIEELEQIAIQNPNLRPQVEAEKAKILEQRINRQFEERDRKVEAQRKSDMIRMQTEHRVMNDQAFKDCFTTDAMGNKQWRLDNPLTNIIGELMRSPELSSRPDGLGVAADIAYGRYMRELASKTSASARTMQATIKREQKKTMVEGGTPGGSSSGGDSFVKAKNELAKTGTKASAQRAVLEYMKKAGLAR